MTKTFFLSLCFFFLNVSAQTFTKSFGKIGVNDGVTSIANSNGKIFLAGYSGKIAYLCEVDKNGTLLWRDEYDFTEQPDYITHITVLENKIIGCGYGNKEETGEYLEFFFKYDIESKSFDWIKRTTLNLKPATALVLPNKNYLISGDESDIDGFRLFLMEVDAENGKLVKYTNWQFSGNESASTTLIHNNFIYTGGRYGLQRKIDKYRGAISKFNLDFDETWSNYYLNNKDKFLRNYLSKIIIDNDELVSLFFTNNHGVNGFYTACLIKQNLDGEMLLASEFTLETYQSINVKDIKATSEGYYIYGYTQLPTVELFLIFADKEGNAIWAKTYGGELIDNLPIDQGNFLEIDNNYIYLIGQSQNINNSTDFDGFLMKLNLDGTSDEKCWEKDVKVNTKNFEELIQGQIFLTRKDSTFRSINLGYKKEKRDESIVFPYFCAPSLAIADYDTIRTAKTLTIDFLANDLIGNESELTTNIVSKPINGNVIIENNKMIYLQNPENSCSVDSFEYEIFSIHTLRDTAKVYIYSESQIDLLPNLTDKVLPESGSIILDASLNSATHYWSNGSDSAIIEIDKPGIYTIEVSQNGCLYSKDITVEENPYSFENVATNNITFLLDASSSMNRSNRLPILKKALYKIMTFMHTDDKLSMVEFSATPKIIFNGINATEIEMVKSKIDSINSEGRSNIKEGVKLAFETVKGNYETEGNNRIIFTTDGDIPTYTRLELIDFMKKSFPANTYFSIFLFNDASLFKTQMQELANAVNGELYVITPENIESVLLKELKAVRR